MVRLNYAWWSTPGSKSIDSISGSGYDRDDIITENLMSKLLVDINRYVITVDGQDASCSGYSKSDMGYAEFVANNRIYPITAKDDGTMRTL